MDLSHRADTVSARRRGRFGAWIERDKAEVLIPVMLRVIPIARAILPGLIDWTMRWTGWQRPRS
jgi:hypothetical protein